MRAQPQPPHTPRPRDDPPLRPHRGPTPNSTAARGRSLEPTGHSWSSSGAPGTPTPPTCSASCGPRYRGSDSLCGSTYVLGRHPARCGCRCGCPCRCRTNAAPQLRPGRRQREPNQGDQTKMYGRVDFDLPRALVLPRPMTTARGSAQSPPALDQGTPPTPGRCRARRDRTRCPCRRHRRFLAVPRGTVARHSQAVSAGQPVSRACPSGTAGSSPSACCLLARWSASPEFLADVKPSGGASWACGWTAGRWSAVGLLPSPALPVILLGGGSVQIARPSLRG
jgi:hypothetical protein